MGRKEFSKSTKQLALLRQKNKCACCGEKITDLGQSGKITHRFGEGANGHHMKHDQQGGSNSLSNCVILCESCHYSVHEGGNYKNNSEYLVGKISDFQFYYG